MIIERVEDGQRQYSHDDGQTWKYYTVEGLLTKLERKNRRIKLLESELSRIQALALNALTDGRA